MQRAYRILAVDDEDFNLDLIGALLAPKGYEVVTASNGKEALDIVDRKNIDLILLDINMPKMSGFEVAKKLRENPETKDIPIFIISSLKQDLNINKAYELGIDEYITKPMNIQHLKLRINKFLQKRGGC